jgi:acyl-CoA thioester hydrolase
VRSPETLRADFADHVAIPTRWEDVDHYGHVNNVSYYSFFDTAVNGWLMSRTATDIRTLDAIGIVAESSCTFLGSLDFPEVVHAWLRVDRLGSSSVTYAIGLFVDADEQPRALGRFVHVYVDRLTRRPVPIPNIIRQALGTLVVDGREPAAPREDS